MVTNSVAPEGLQCWKLFAAKYRHLMTFRQFKIGVFVQYGLNIWDCLTVVKQVSLLEKYIGRILNLKQKVAWDGYIK